MTIPPRVTRIGALGALMSALVLGGTAVAPATAQPQTARTVAVQPSARSAVAPHATGHVCTSSLPSQAHDTLDLIASGGPFPYPEDGEVFQNREGVLPQQSTGYYHEYTVDTPGSSDRGARRIVTGEGKQEDYYTSDHYETFDLIDFTC